MDEDMALDSYLEAQYEDRYLDDLDYDGDPEYYGDDDEGWYDSDEYDDES